MITNVIDLISICHCISADTIITECYISDIHMQLNDCVHQHSGGKHTQAIQGQNGLRGYQIVNCYLEAGDENILFGGGDPQNSALGPADIYIFGNYFSKPPKWRNGDPNSTYIPGVKNLFELNAQNIKIEGNIFENIWRNRDQGPGAIGHVTKIILLLNQPLSKHYSY